jgi:hypothetical protein
VILRDRIPIDAQISSEADIKIYYLPETATQLDWIVWAVATLAIVAGFYAVCEVCARRD